MMVLLGPWLGQIGGSPINDWFIAQGVLGVVALVLGLFARQVISDLRKENADLRQRERETIEKVYGRILPMMERNIEVTNEMTRTFRDLVDELRS